jgi:hypothetical protein
MSTAIDSIARWLLRMLCERAPRGIRVNRPPESLCPFCTPAPRGSACFQPAFDHSGPGIALPCPFPLASDVLRMGPRG